MVKVLRRRVRKASPKERRDEVVNITEVAFSAAKNTRDLPITSDKKKEAAISAAKNGK